MALTICGLFALRLEAIASRVEAIAIWFLLPLDYIIAIVFNLLSGRDGGTVSFGNSKEDLPGECLPAATSVG